MKWCVRDGGSIFAFVATSACTGFSCDRAVFELLTIEHAGQQRTSNSQARIVRVRYGHTQLPFINVDLSVRDLQFVLKWFNLNVVVLEIYFTSLTNPGDITGCLSKECPFEARILEIVFLKHKRVVIGFRRELNFQTLFSAHRR
jgi:hypothetical protein